MSSSRLPLVFQDALFACCCSTEPLLPPPTPSSACISAPSSSSPCSPARNFLPPSPLPAFPGVCFAPSPFVPTPATVSPVVVVAAAATCRLPCGDTAGFRPAPDFRPGEGEDDDEGDGDEEGRDRFLPPPPLVLPLALLPLPEPLLLVRRCDGLACCHPGTSFARTATALAEPSPPTPSSCHSSSSSSSSSSFWSRVCFSPPIGRCGSRFSEVLGPGCCCCCCFSCPLPTSWFFRALTVIRANGKAPRDGAAPADNTTSVTAASTWDDDGEDGGGPLRLCCEVVTKAGIHAPRTVRRLPHLASCFRGVFLGTGGRERATGSAAVVSSMRSFEFFDVDDKYRNRLRVSLRTGICFILFWMKLSRGNRV